MLINNRVRGLTRRVDPDRDHKYTSCESKIVFLLLLPQSRHDLGLILRSRNNSFGRRACLAGTSWLYALLSHSERLTVPIRSSSEQTLYRNGLASIGVSYGTNGVEDDVVLGT